MSIKVVLSEKPSFTTDKGLIRAQEILFAAHRILATKGYAGLSMRGVATYLQISLSTVLHYYKSKELLVEALLSYVLDSYQRSIADLIQSMTEKTHQERFIAIMDMLLLEIRRPETYGIYAEIWALANRMPFAARLVERVQVREHKEIFKLIYGLEPCMPVSECKLRATLTIAQLHGLMLHFSRHSEAMPCCQHIETAAGQSFIRLAMLA